MTPLEHGPGCYCAHCTAAWQERMISTCEAFAANMLVALCLLAASVVAGAVLFALSVP